MIYFLRDFLFEDVRAQIDAGVRPKDLRPLIARLNVLNSKISAYEAAQWSSQELCPRDNGEITTMTQSLPVTSGSNPNALANLNRPRSPTPSPSPTLTLN